MDGYAPTHEELLAATQTKFPDLTADEQVQVATIAASLFPAFKEPLVMVKVARYKFNKTQV